MDCVKCSRIENRSKKTVFLRSCVVRWDQIVIMVTMDRVLVASFFFSQVQPLLSQLVVNLMQYCSFCINYLFAY
jgi:hypothetical protein